MALLASCGHSTPKRWRFRATTATARSCRSAAASAKIGVLFIDFERPHRTRVQASAILSDDADLLAAFPGAQRVVEAEIQQIFINCSRYIHRMSRVEASK
jgi:hypothetical protein